MLDGRIAYVTGATRGIGEATARAFARHGATVFLNGRDAERTHAVAAAIQDEFGTPCTGVVADQTDPDAAGEAFRTIFKEHKRLDVLVNNAGVLDDALLGMISEESMTETFAVNALAVARNMQRAVRLMERAGGGSIVNVASIIGTNGNAGQVVYGGSKAAVIGMTRSAAKELAPKSIRVNAVAPGFIDTDMARSIPAETFDERIASIGMGRIGTPDDVANVVLFLASDLASYVTGQTIGVDGAMLI